MSTHVLTCECGWRIEIEGWLDALVGCITVARVMW